MWSKICLYLSYLYKHCSYILIGQHYHTFHEEKHVTFPIYGNVYSYNERKNEVENVLLLKDLTLVKEKGQNGRIICEKQIGNVKKTNFFLRFQASLSSLQSTTQTCSMAASAGLLSDLVIDYMKCKFPMTSPVGRLVGRSVIIF